ncbi:MAG: SAM-dependent chlorinase/fluorinase [Chloroflexi bacterium]|nr:SAM-dependent chlorinase/fluorinase [Chloroflexota bacterium]
MAVISLMTDFGIKDGNVGVMKGVIWSISSNAQISDLSHMIAPQNIREAALILARSAPYFPENSIHVVVVDPGVGTTRRPLAAKIGSQYYVGPDNGTITLLLEQAVKEGWPVEFVHLDQPDYWLSNVSYVFHGRDIFAPVAAHISSGVPLKSLGTPINDPVLLDLPKPEKTINGWKGELIHIDHFGNVASNIRTENLGDVLKNMAGISVRIAGFEIKGLVNTFGERAVGELIALLGSTGNLIVSVVNGSAAGRLDAKVGDTLEVIVE